jgi:alpha-beta hydrolase superfamily lysophospholipase
MAVIPLVSAMPAFANTSDPPLCAEASKTQLPLYEWKQERAVPKGVVLMLHGITQRAATLQDLGKKLSHEGFLVYGLDERGFGWWHFDQKQGDRGYKCDFKSSVKDTDKVLTLLRQEHPALPIFLVGESVGAAVAWRAAADSPDAVDGIVVAGSGSKAVRPKMTWVIADTLKDSYRWNHQTNVVRYQLKYGTDDLAGFKQTLLDPEQRKTLSLSETIQADLFIRKNGKFAKAIDPHIAVLVVQGADDKVLSPKSAKKVFAVANTEDKKMVVVPNCGHILLGLPKVKPLVGDSIASFLDEQSARGQVAAGPATVPQ